MGPHFVDVLLGNGVQIFNELEGPQHQFGSGTHR